MSLVYLFYGVHYSANYLYQSALEEFQVKRGLNCHIAASRDAKSAHVQDKLKECKLEVLELLEKHASVLVCGSRKFVASVEDCLVNILGEEGKTFLEELKHTKRFLWESWGE
jgi:sulfite reductase alpha subunit-like flavoprotein